MYIMQSVHASKIASHMNKMYGDFGKFSESPKGNVEFQPIVEMSNHSQIATEIKVYASGYNTALDEAAAPELLEALEALLNQFDERGYYANTHANVTIAMEAARAAIAKAKGE